MRIKKTDFSAHLIKSAKRYRLMIVISMLPFAGLCQDDIYTKYDIYRNPVRVFLNKLSITLTTGYGYTTYRHDLSGVYFYQDEVSQFIFSNAAEPELNFTGFTDWLNNPQVGFQTPVDRGLLLDTDSVNVGFKGIADDIPINLMIHYEYQKFRGGIGYAREFQFVRSLEPTFLGDRIRNYQPNFKGTSFTKFYGMLGYKFRSWWHWDFVAEANIGKINPGPRFNRSAISRGLYYNIGISFENNWSEYVRLVIRPSVDIKSYKVNLPDGASVKHNQPAFFLQFGLSINIPEIPLSPMKSDHTQLKHVYTNPKTGQKMEVRGQSIWRRQNPKAGENHRKPNQHLPSRKNRIKSKKRN
ncbi:MAG: hypothetical protein GDA37_04445 [Ekhidna sp.]|nr:hypothetical protein [Ekhidna sp.]